MAHQPIETSVEYFLNRDSVAIFGERSHYDKYREIVKRDHPFADKILIGGSGNWGYSFNLYKLFNEFSSKAWINELRNNESLEINPDFQRRAVWLANERSQLLNTIISKLPFPEIYYQVETDINTGKQKYIVVDGQQRTTSILKFIEPLAKVKNYPSTSSGRTDVGLKS